jgi:hypothetical protein
MGNLNTKNAYFLILEQIVVFKQFSKSRNLDGMASKNPSFKKKAKQAIRIGGAHETNLNLPQTMSFLMIT